MDGFIKVEDESVNLLAVPAFSFTKTSFVLHGITDTDSVYRLSEAQLEQIKSQILSLCRKARISFLPFYVEHYDRTLFINPYQVRSISKYDEFVSVTLMRRTVYINKSKTKSIAEKVFFKLLQRWARSVNIIIASENLCINAEAISRIFKSYGKVHVLSISGELICSLTRAGMGDPLTLMYMAERYGKLLTDLMVEQGLGEL